jgi:hypothetical protein
MTETSCKFTRLSKFPEQTDKILSNFHPICSGLKLFVVSELYTPLSKLSKFSPLIIRNIKKKRKEERKEEKRDKCRAKEKGRFAQFAQPALFFMCKSMKTRALYG